MLLSELLIILNTTVSIINSLSLVMDITVHFLPFAFVYEEMSFMMNMKSYHELCGNRLVIYFRLLKDSFDCTLSNIYG